MQKGGKRFGEFTTHGKGDEGMREKMEPVKVHGSGESNPQTKVMLGLEG